MAFPHLDRCAAESEERLTPGRITGNGGKRSETLPHPRGPAKMNDGACAHICPLLANVRAFAGEQSYSAFRDIPTVCSCGFGRRPAISAPALEDSFEIEYADVMAMSPKATKAGQKSPATIF